MKILFVYSLCDIQSPKKPLRSPEQIQFGISYISAVLSAGGHETKLAVLGNLGSFGKGSRRKNRRIMDTYLRDFKPSLICFTAISTEFDFITEAAKYVKLREPKIFLLAGGPHVSLNPSEAMLDTFDALCICEGEYPTLELAQQLQEGKVPAGIANLWIKRDGQIEKNSTRPFIQDLDSLPFADRTMWDDWIDPQPGARHSVLLGRGCPFQCTYCSNHALKKLADGKYVRFRSPENIAREIRQLVQAYPDQEEIYLEVESFSVNTGWAVDVCSKLRELNDSLPKPLSFGVNVRITPNVDFDGLFEACAASNFRFVNIGLESGSDRVRREVLNRNYSNEDVEKAVSLARKHSLQVVFFNIVGLPGETPDDFHQTVQMNRRCMPDWHHTSIFYPYPGTALYGSCIERSLLKSPIETRMERARALLDMPEFTRKQVQHCYTWFDYYVYRGRKPVWKILAKVAVTKCMSNPYLFYLYRRLTSLKFLRRLKQFVK